MIQNLAKSNPRIAQAIPIVQEIMAQGGSKKEQSEAKEEQEEREAIQNENNYSISSDDELPF